MTPNGYNFEKAGTPYLAMRLYLLSQQYPGGFPLKELFGLGTFSDAVKELKDATVHLEPSKIQAVNTGIDFESTMFHRSQAGTVVAHLDNQQGFDCSVKLLLGPELTPQTFLINFKRIQNSAADKTRACSNTTKKFPLNREVIISNLKTKTLN